MIGKLRPVGSRVPLPSQSPESLPWGEHYHTEFCCSGTDALAIAVGIAAARKPEISQPEVIIPAYGCPDLVSAITSQGAKPVLVDILPGGPFLDDQLVQESVSESTVAIVGVGFLGLPERLELLHQISRKHDVLLIEDSAQCFPPASSMAPLADCVVLSFGRGKPINLMGGGALLCRYTFLNEAWVTIRKHPKLKLQVGLLWYLKRFLFNLLLSRTLFGMLERVPLLGVGKTILRPHKAIFRCDIPDELVFGAIREYGRRPLIHYWYDRNLGFLEASGWQLLSGRSLAWNFVETSSPMLRYGILAPNREARDEAIKALNLAGIGANAFYGLALHEIEGVSEKVKTKSHLAADNFASRLITLPCHEDVAQSDLQRVADILERFALG